MAKSHIVDFLNSGFVVKTAMAETFNKKLKAEVEQIRLLHTLYPEFMVPILHEGLAGGRQFYILEKKNSLPLSNIVFDEFRPLSERRKIVQNTLEKIKKAIEREIDQQIPTSDYMTSKLQEEWEGTSFAHALFEQPILLNGNRFNFTAKDIFEKALALAGNEKFLSVKKAHFNFHFGNVLYDEAQSLTNFIDPDFSVNGIDPVFGFSRFAFSFWHELATEVQDAVKIVPMPDSLMFVLAKQDYSNILSEIPEVGNIDGIMPFMDKSMRNRFYVLTTYCFLRSIRINGSKQKWKAPCCPTTAKPEEVLMLGMLNYLEGTNVKSKNCCA